MSSQLEMTLIQEKFSPGSRDPPLLFQAAEYHGLSEPEKLLQLQWQNGGSRVCGHCWMTSILLPSTRWPHMLKPPSKVLCFSPACTSQALISQPQCWLQMLSSWELPGGSVTCFAQFSAASNPVVPQLQRQFTAEIDHNTFIYRHLTLTLANPPFKQLEVTSPFGKIQLSTMLTESHGLENVQVGKRISNQREIGAKNRDTSQTAWSKHV